MEDSPADWLRVARYANQQRRNLRRAKHEAGVSANTWRKLENGRPLSDESVFEIESELRWEHGSIAAILAGGEPIAARGPDPEVRGGEVAYWTGESGKLIGGIRSLRPEERQQVLAYLREALTRLD